MRVKIITPDSTHAEAWVAALARQQRASDVAAIQRPLHTVNVLVNGSVPDLVVAEAMDARDLDALESLANAHPEIEYVLVSSELSPDALMRMMRAGVREVLPAPAPPDAVQAAVQRLARKRQHQAPAAAASRHGQIVSVLSCKGGSGATVVAANLAHMLAAGGERRVALVDLNLQFGDAALHLSSERLASNMADVARSISRLDRDFLQSAMLAAAPGLWVLGAPEDPASASEVLPEHAKAVLELARDMFDFVVVDAGRNLSAVTLQALDLSDGVYPVVQLTLPYIRGAKHLQDVFRSLDYPSRKIHWLVNRYQKDSQLTLDDLRKTLGVTELTVLPNQYEPVAAAVNQGVPVATIAAGSAIAKALREFAGQLAPLPERARAGWLSGLLRGGGRSKGNDAS